MLRDRGQSRGGLAVLGCCCWLSGAVTERTRGAVSVAYVLQDLLTTTDVRTRMAQLGSRLCLPITRHPGCFVPAACPMVADDHAHQYDLVGSGLAC